MMTQDRNERQRSRVFIEIRGDIANSDTLLGINAPRPYFPPRQLCADLFPPLTPRGLMHGKIGVLQEIHRKYLLEHHFLGVWIPFEGSIVKLKRGCNLSLRQMA